MTASAAPIAFAPGLTLHGRRGQPYELVRPLGQGGFADTYIARADGKAEPVVVKILRPERAGTWKAVELFEREARVLRGLRHPNIPAYLDEIALGDVRDLTGFALVQEYVPGPTLRELMQRGERLGEIAMRAWFTRVLEVCSYLHDQSPPVMHRDIHPGNVVLRESDGDAVLIDFGAVQVALGGGTAISSTAAGTFGYAPLEQFVGRATPASDLYSAAVTFVAVATGREPHDLPFSANRIQIGEALRGVPIAARLLLLLEEMTEPDAARRPQRAADVLARLADIPVARSAPSQEATPAAPQPSAIDAAAIDTAAGVERRWREVAARTLRIPTDEAWRLPEYPSLEAVPGFRASPDGRYAWITEGFGDAGCALLELDRLRMRTVIEPQGPGTDLTLGAEGLGAVVAGFSGARAVVLAADGAVREIPLPVASSTAFWMKPHHLSVAFSLDRRLLAFILGFGDDAGGYLFDLENGKLVQRFAPPQDRLATMHTGELRFAPDRRSLLLRSGRATWVMSPAGEWTQLEETVAFDPDGRRAARALQPDGRLLVGELECLAPPAWRGAPLALQTGGGSVERMRFSPDGRLLVVAVEAAQVEPNLPPGADRGETRRSAHRVLVFDADSGQRICEADALHRPCRRIAEVADLAITEDNRRLIVHGEFARTPTDDREDKALAIYELPAGRPLGTLVRVEGDALGLLAVTTAGFKAALTGKNPRGASGPAHRREVVTAVLRGEVPALAERDAERAADLAGRVRFWTEHAARQRLPGSAVGELVAASRGLTHLLPAAVHRARQAPQVAAPQVLGGPMMSPAAPLLDELAALGRRGAAEREVLFEDMLLRVAAEETRRAADLAAQREREGRAAAWSRHRHVVVIAAGAAVAAAVALWVLLRGMA